MNIVNTVSGGSGVDLSSIPIKETFTISGQKLGVWEEKKIDGYIASILFEHKSSSQRGTEYFEIAIGVIDNKDIRLRLKIPNNQPNGYFNMLSMPILYQYNNQGEIVIDAFGGSALATTLQNLPLNIIGENKHGQVIPVAETYFSGVASRISGCLLTQPIFVSSIFGVSKQTDTTTSPFNGELVCTITYFRK